MEEQKTGFESFVGKTVLVNKTTETAKIGGKEYSNPRCKISNEDVVIAEVCEVATKHSLRCRVWLPGTIGTMDYRLDRLNVKVEEQTDGSFQITRIYFG
jgi:hypothetical protein